MTAEQLNCPECGQVDMVQKVSAIFSGGITTGTYSGPSIGVAVPIGKGQTSVAGGYTNLKGGSQSLLSSRLSPPSKPTAQKIPSAQIGTGIALLCIGILFAFSSVLMAIICIFGGITILVWCYIAAEGRRIEADSLLPQWEESMARWHRLYYCARDDGVFDPNERVFVPTS